MLNIHQLELFYFVVKYGGITSAVRQMPYGIQQPAVSGQILKLEEKIGVSLFQRRPFVLTEAGQQIFEFILPFFGGLGDLEDRIAKSHQPKLRLASSNNVLRDHLPDLFREVRKAWPNMQLSLRETSQLKAEEMLREGELDFAVVTKESTPGSGLHSRELLKLPLILVVPKTDRKVTAKNLLEQANIRSLIALPPKERVTQIFQRQLAKSGSHWDIKIEANSLDVVHSCTMEGFGVGLSLDIPGKTIPKGVRRIELSGFPKVEIIALWKGRLEGPVEHFFKCVQQRANRLKSIRQ